MKKVIKFKPKGMNRDLSKATFSPEFSYENKNVRFVTNEANSLLSITNEKGPEYNEKLSRHIENTSVLGYTTLNDTIILFCKGEDKDYIVVSEGETIKKFEGTLDFDGNYPIEAIAIYENEKVKKVYWTDGKNPPRVLNICNETLSINNNHVNFTPDIQPSYFVEVSKDDNASGSFPSGTIQYSFTYINENGSESNIFYTSPLFYTAYNDRGASPEETISTGFKMHLRHLDPYYKYIRVYSVLRTSINATPICKRVIDLHINNGSVSYIRPESANYIQIEYDLTNIKIGYTLNGGNIIEDSLHNFGSTYVSDYDSANGFNFINHGSSKSDSNTIIEIKYIKWVIDNNIYELNEQSTPEAFKEGREFIFSYSDKNDIQEERTTINVNDGSTYLSLKQFITYTNDYHSYYIDNGLNGDNIDPTELLYIGGEKLIAQTISHKDNTLFLGNIKYDALTIDLSFEGEGGNRPSVTFNADKSLPSPTYTGYYSYKNNLNKSNWEITTFKYNEWYRFGLQAQHSTGKWSEPIWINDCKNSVHIRDNGDTPKLVTAEFTINQEIVNTLHSNGYIKVRPVIVYPSINDRDCICQGVVCPSVYNIEDRVSNSPYAQASWIFRPDFKKAPFEDFSDSDYNSEETKYYPIATRKNSFEHDFTISQSKSTDFDGDVFQYTEIQCLEESPYYPFLTNTNNVSDTVLDNWVTHNSEYFFVDRSIVTLNSPDIEFDSSLYNIDLSNTKFRIVGFIPIHSNYTNVEVITRTPPVYREGSGTGLGSLAVQDQFPYNKEGAGVGMVTDFLWKDFLTSNKEDNQQREFPVYLWHREGSVNGTSELAGSDEAITAELKNKRTSILRTSKYTTYLDSTNGNKGIWEPTYSSKNALFNLSDIGITKIDSQKQSINPDIIYYGNIDKIVNITADDYDIVSEYSRGGGVISRLNIKRNRTNGYKLWERADKNSGIAKISDIKSTAPINLRYKSSPHIVVAFNYKPDNSDSEITVECLPYCKSKAVRHPAVVQANSNPTQLPRNVWNKKINKINISKREDVDVDGFLWLGELYRENVVNRFGGTTREALENNSWLPCGESVLLEEDKSVVLKWVGGDTYYQRYDCMKTYPFSFEDKNQLTDVLSFMCETRINIDGRYDKNRGSIVNSHVSPANFNLVNSVYSQQDNFFNYRIVTDKDNYANDFPTTVTWSKTKTSGEKVDSWTNITLASTLELDGDKGPITSLQRLNNQIIAFQSTGISHILYNENTQISTEAGVPIEIANSGKVSGKRYISDRIGCYNKWSICSSPKGIYFIDDVNKDINLFNGEQIINLSDTHGFKSWIVDNAALAIWKPSNYNNFTSHYDAINNDILFINNDYCLAYSEKLGQFTSFYDYNGVTHIINNPENTILIKESKAYNHNKGYYNRFFDNNSKPFYIEVIANENPTLDKIFTNVEFTSDTWNNTALIGNTFDTLTVHNEYQQGSVDLSFIKNKPSPLKRKFRIWRADIPRDSNNSRDRMRNTWLNIKLEKKNKDNNTNKTILHDLSVYYHV